MVARMAEAKSNSTGDLKDFKAAGMAYEGAAAHLPEVWVALRASLRSVLEHVTLADLASGRLPAVVKDRTKAKDSWRAH